MMKKLLLLLFICSTSSLVLAQGLPELMYYKFDGAGTAVSNLASTPVGTNPATIIGGQTQGPTGQFGNALIGTGGTSTVDYLDTGWPTSLSGDWTISYWVSNIAPSTTLYYILGDQTAGNFRCFTNGVAGANNWMLRGTGVTDVLVSGGATVAPHVIHFVYDNSVPEIRAFLDGVLVNTVGQAAINLTGTGPFKVGASTGTGLAPGGLMDEFRMYSRALTAAEVSATWNQSLPLVVGPKDLALNGLLSPSSGNVGCYGATETVEVSLFNFGTDTVFFPTDNAQITVNATGVNPQTFQTTLNTGFLTPGGNTSVIMNTNFNMGAGGTYTFNGYVEFLTGGPDANLANDTMATSNVTSNNAVVLPGQSWSEDFETFVVGNPGTLANGWTRGTLSSPSNNVWNVEDATGANENSTGTGPFFDNTTFGTPGGIYMFIETSGGVVGTLHDLVSPCIDLSGVTGPTLEYSYHMFGADMGYLLAQVLSNGVWTTVDSLDGPQQVAGGDPWGTRTASLGLYAGQVIQLRFVAQKKSTGFQNDASIDDILIFEPAPNDLFHAGTTDPTSPACSFTASEPVTIDIQNVGSATLNLTDIEATYTITGPVNSGPITETLTGAGTLTPGSTLSYTFTTTADLSTPGLYTIASGVNFTVASGLIDPALAANVDTISVQPGLVGNFTIDGTLPTGGTNYQTFSEAAADLNTFGLCGPVVFNVQAGTYTDQMTLSQLIGSDATNTVTFDGGTNAPVLTYDVNAAEQATILLSGTDHIFIQNMTIENLKTSEGWGILLTGGADFVTIDNCNINLNTAATFDVAGIISSGNTINDNIAGANASNLTISNNTIVGGERSITLEGVENNPTQSVGFYITNNSLTFADDFGIFVDDLDSIFVSGNTIANLRNLQSDGVFLSDVNNYFVDGNQINAQDWGMYIFDGNDLATLSVRSYVRNNMLQSGNDFATYFNDIESTDIFGNTFSGNVGVRVNDAISVDLRGNIFNGTNSFALWLDDGYNGIDSLDYNLYNAAGDVANLGAIGTVVDLASWQTTAPGANVNSIQGDPDFISATDLHIAGTLPNNIGDPSLGLIEDIDGDVRSLTTPDIGGDEFTPLPADLGLVSFALPISGCGLQVTNPIAIQVRNFGTDTAFTFDLSFRLAGVITTETFMDTLLPGQTKTFTFVATADLSTVGATYTFDGWPTLTGDTNFGNDSIIGYDVEHYNAISVFPYTESFDVPGGTLPAGWIQQLDDNGQDWFFDQNGTPTGGTGPSVDHTSGTTNGYYAYVEDTGFDNDSVTLITPCFDVSTLLAPKFSFWYHSNSSQGANGTQENEMHLDLIYNGTITYDFIPPIVHKDNNWNLIELNMSAYPGVFAFRFRVNNRNTNGQVHDIAIDDISVVDVLPQDVGVTALLDPIGGCGLLANDTIILGITNLGTDSVKGGFDVSYQLNGGAVSTVSITDTILAGNTLAVPFFPVDLSVPGTYTLTAWTSGLIGDTNLGNDTLMEVIISEPSIPVPFSEDFESYSPPATTFLEFSNDPNAQIDWRVNSGGTGSGGTGPTGAFEGSNYIYMETSGPAAGSQAILRSNCLDLTSAANPSLFYAYHMFGTTVGFLSVDVEANSGITNVATFTGSQQTANADPWRLDTVDLSPWLGQSIRLIFTGETNGSFTSDISLDAIDIRELVDDDMGALGVLQPSAAECNSDSTVVEVEITNTGIQPQVNIPVTVNYSGAATGTITTIVPGPIAPGAVVSVIVGTVNTNVGGTFNFAAFTALAGDTINSNDTIFSSTDVTVRPPAPTAVMDTVILCTPDSTVLSVVNDTAYSYLWYTVPVGGVPFAIDTADIQTTFLTNDTVLYVEAVTKGSSPLIKVTEAELLGPDYLEIQNTGNSAVDVTGWTVAIGEDGAAGINDVETVMWTMAGVMTPGEIRFRADNAAAGANYWGANILWNGGQEGWVVVLDANNIVVDVMFFNYTDADILGFAPTINGTVIDITGKWSGPGIDVNSPVNAQNVYRVGTFDNNDATDWLTSATAAFAGIGTLNPGLSTVVTGGGGSGACPSEPRTPIAVLVAPPVQLDLGPDGVTCAGFVVDASDPSIASYTWNTGDVTSSITVNVTGVYYVDVVDINGCVGTDTINLNILPSPTVDLGQDSLISCGGLTLDAGNAGSSFLWSVAGQFQQTLQVTTTGTYWVEANLNGCIDTDTIYIEVLPAPSVSFGGTIAACDDVTLDAGNPGSTYVWSTGATSQTITVTPPATGGDTITVTVTNVEGCDVTEQVIITPGVDPVVDLGADLTECDSVLLDAGNAGATYAWSTGETSQTIYATTDGNYTVTVTDPTGCESTDDINVTLEFSPVATIGVNSSFGYTYDFTNLSTAGAGVVWKFGDGTPNSTDPNPTHVYAFDGSYVVTLVVTNNCGTDSTTITLGSVDIDDLFSQSLDVFPNPTAGNFFIKSAELQADNLTIEVYDAKGSVIYRKQLGRVNGVEEQIDLSTHPKGVYMVKISDGSRSATKRVIRE